MLRSNSGRKLHESISMRHRNNYWPDCFAYSALAPMTPKFIVIESSAGGLLRPRIKISEASAYRMMRLGTNRAEPNSRMPASCHLCVIFRQPCGTRIAICHRL